MRASGKFISDSKGEECHDAHVICALTLDGGNGVAELILGWQFSIFAKDVHDSVQSFVGHYLQHSHQGGNWSGCGEVDGVSLLLQSTQRNANHGF